MARPAKPSRRTNIQVRFNHQRTKHSGNWVDQKDDGTIEVKLPADAKVIAVRATYDNSMEYFVNCDVAKQKDSAVDSWYPVADILTIGHRDSERLRQAERCRQSEGRCEARRVCSLREKAELEGRSERVLALRNPLRDGQRETALGARSPGMDGTHFFP